MTIKKATVQDGYNDFLNNLLRDKLFLAAIDVNDKLVKTFNVTPDNARKIVGRAVGQKIIKSSKPYTFGKGQFIYIYNDYGLGKDVIKDISKKNRPPIYRLLELMDNSGGITSYYEALKITAAPLQESSTKVVSLDDILTLLMKLEIVDKKKDSNEVVYIIYRKNETQIPGLTEEMMMAYHYNKMIVDSSIIPDILRWLGNANLLDNSTAIYRNKKRPHVGAAHNNLIWDAFGYTKATGINPILGAKADNIDKQTLVVLDVILADEYSEIHLDAFLARIQINRKSVTMTERKILPIIVYKSLLPITYNKIKMNGLIAFDIASIFGTRIYEILNSISELSTLSMGNGYIEKTIARIFKTIAASGQVESLKELRGTLFEYLMYPLLTTLYPNASILRNKILSRLNSSGKKEGYEYDYIIQANNPPELVFVELKGYHSGAIIALGDTDTKNSLQWFFRRTLPFAEKYYKEKLGNQIPVKAVFITSAGFWENGHEFLKTMDGKKYQSKKLNVGLDRQSLIALLKEYDFSSEIKILKQFYSKDEEEDSKEMVEFERNVLKDIEHDDLPF